MPVTWMKHKYRSHKIRGRYPSSHNDSHKKQKKTGNSVGIPREPEGIRTLVILPTGKRRWTWEPKK